MLEEDVYMAISNDILWKRITVEGAAVVLSILLAFWIDAWWEDRQERSEEQIVLATLLTELRSAQAIRTGNDEYFSAIIESCRKLLQFARNPMDNVSDRQIDLWLNDTTWSASSLTIDASVLDSLHSSGDIVLVANNELRLLLARLSQAYAVERTKAFREISFIDNRYYPYLDVNGSIGQIYGADDGMPGIPPEEGATSSSYPLGSEVVTHLTISHRDMVSKLEFQNILIQRTFYLNNIDDWAEDLPNVDLLLKTSIELIEQELED